MLLLKPSAFLSFLLKIHLENSHLIASKLRAKRCLLGHTPWVTIIQTDIHRDPVFTAALFTIARIRKQSKYPLTDEWIKRMRCMNTMEYYSAIKKNEIMPFAATGGYHFKWSRWEKTSIICYHLYLESKIRHKRTYSWNRLTDVGNNSWLAKGKEVGRDTGEVWDSAYESFGMSNRQQGPAVQHKELYSILCDKP